MLTDEHILHDPKILTTLEEFTRIVRAQVEAKRAHPDDLVELRRDTADSQSA